MQNQANLTKTRTYRCYWVKIGILDARINLLRFLVKNFARGSYNKEFIMTGTILNLSSV